MQNVQMQMKKKDKRERQRESILLKEYCEIELKMRDGERLRVFNYEDDVENGYIS